MCDVQLVVGCIQPVELVDQTMSQITELRPGEEADNRECYGQRKSERSVGTW